MNYFLHETHKENECCGNHRGNNQGTPYLFASFKVSIAISLVGAIVGELPAGARAGLGARLLTGSYYGQTVQIWSALIVASVIAATLVFLMSFMEKLVQKRMGH